MFFFNPTNKNRKNNFKILNYFFIGNIFSPYSLFFTV